MSDIIVIAPPQPAHVLSKTIHMPGMFFRLFSFFWNQIEFPDDETKSFGSQECSNMLTQQSRELVVLDASSSISIPLWGGR